MMNMINNIKDFASEIKEVVEGNLGEGYVVQIREVVKNNDTRLTGLIIREEDNNIAPTTYLEPFYAKYKAGETTITTVSEDIIRIYDEHKDDCEFDISFVYDFERAKERICFRLINAERNKELLEDAPHLSVCDDLAVVFYLLVSSDADGNATITIRNNIFEQWEITPEELFKIALFNTQELFRESISSLASVVRNILDNRDDKEFFDMVIPDDEPSSMFVCTNDAKMYGAGVILYKNLLKDFAERIDNDLYIIPSSVHETLLLPISDEMDVEYLRNLVREVNITEVSPEEVLSDNLYVYSRQEDKISIV